MVCISMLLFMTSFNLVLPQLNQFITNLGGEEHKFLIIMIFTISAAISRPFSGKLADFVGRKRVMFIGVVVSAIISLIYPLTTSVFFFLILRFMHGFSVGFMPTGATALVTDILPFERRAVGMGIWGTFISLGIGVGQGLSTPIEKLAGLNGLFMVSSAVALISMVLVFNITETLKNKEKFKFKHLRLKWQDVFEPVVMPAAVVMFLSASCSGIIFVLSPDMSGFLHIDNKGFFFLFYVLSTIVFRLFTSRLSDVIGRRETLLIGMVILTISMVLIATASGTISYSIASVVFGIATGVSSPTIFTWTADLSHIDRRGVGAGTMFIALELGIMFGSITTTFFYRNTFDTAAHSFYLGAAIAGLCCLYLLWHLKFRKSLT